MWIYARPRGENLGLWVGGGGGGGYVAELMEYENSEDCSSVDMNFTTNYFLKRLCVHTVCIHVYVAMCCV